MLEVGVEPGGAEHAAGFFEAVVEDIVDGIEAAIEPVTQRLVTQRGAFGVRRCGWVPCRRTPSSTQRRRPSSGTMPTSTGACARKVGRLGLGSVAW